MEVPEWVDEEKFIARLKRMAEKMIYEELSAEEVREIFGTFEEEVEPVNVREREREVNRMQIARFCDDVKL